MAITLGNRFVAMLTGSLALCAPVSTYKLSADPRLLYGAVLGPAARAMDRRATGAAAGSRR
jgi:hypothetical protein